MNKTRKEEIHMKKTWFIADLHLGHQKIIDFELRPFKTLEEMDEAIVENWNSVVGDNDDIFVLGDFSFYDKEKTTEICKKLKGRKILIMGCHDEESVSYYMECGFEEVYNYPIIYREFFMLSHKPLYINTNMPYANIFGHVHSNVMYKTYSSQSACVCVERTSYYPLDFGFIVKLMKEAKEKENKNDCYT